MEIEKLFSKDSSLNCKSPMLNKKTINIELKLPLLKIFGQIN